MLQSRLMKLIKNFEKNSKYNLTNDQIDVILWNRLITRSVEDRLMKAVLIKKLWKKFKTRLEKMFNACYIKEPTIALVAKTVKLMNLKKVRKKYKTLLDKLKKLWYIKEPSIALKDWQLIENWIVRCEPWNSLEISTLRNLRKKSKS